MPNFVVGAPAGSDFWAGLDATNLVVNPFRGQANANLVLVSVDSPEDEDKLRQLMQEFRDAKGPFQPLSESSRKASIKLLNTIDRVNLAAIEEIVRKKKLNL